MKIRIFTYTDLDPSERFRGAVSGRGANIPLIYVKQNFPEKEQAFKH